MLDLFIQLSFHSQLIVMDSWWQCTDWCPSGR